MIAGTETPFPLQWGRDQLIAETRAHRRRLTRGAMLQWGRDQLIAETGPGCLNRLRCDYASMGPRSIDRGNNRQCGNAGPGWQASMGPRSIDRGNHAPGPPPEYENPASMGPRSIDRGNSISRKARIVKDLSSGFRAGPSTAAETCFQIARRSHNPLISHTNPGCERPRLFLRHPAARIGSQRVTKTGYAPISPCKNRASKRA